MKTIFTILLLSFAFLNVALATPGSNEEVQNSTLDTIPNVVTKDIKAGIEKHIEELSKANGGFFPILFEKTQYNSW